MMEIEVLGPGCARCKATADLIGRVAGETGKAVNLVKIEDMRQIMGYGVMSTPAVVVGGKVVHKGSVPTREQVLGWLGA
jgi:small redox-active disulfide protein 2